jgi:hypothetical protein
MEVGQAIDAVTGTRRLGCVLPFDESELGRCRQQYLTAVAQRFVSFSANPQAMQQRLLTFVPSQSPLGARGFLASGCGGYKRWKVQPRTRAERDRT